MSIRSVLITGGAGFIGSHVADELLASGYTVRALDSLSPAIHGDGRRRPPYLSRDVELQIGDVRDPAAVGRALVDIDAVFHFAATVGVGQSMYEITHYTSVNNLGTAVLMEAILKHPVARVVVASSMSVYGEGLLVDMTGAVQSSNGRSLEQLRRGEWELSDGHGGVLTPVPTPETKQVSLDSIYALSKYDQERMCLMLGRAYRVPTVALRFFNVFGTRQPLSSPYTGVLAIFASRLLNGNTPLVFEDGNQKRDFVSVKDVARACRLALEKDDAAGRVINIGSGRPHSIADIARKMAAVTGRTSSIPEVTGKYRMGDVRHCFGDISLARAALGYEPSVDLGEGLAELALWLDGHVSKDRAAHARPELGARGLTCA